MHCQKCGNNISEESSFCGKCGGTVVKQINTKTVANPPEKAGKKIVGVVISILAFIIAFVVFRYITQQGISAVSNTTSKQDLIHQVVQIAKSKTSLPQELDKVTTYTNIEEDTGAIRYDYILHDIDESQVSNTVLRNILTPSVCQNPSTKSILDKDINLEYSYQVKDSAMTYFVTISKSDCL